ASPGRNTTAASYREVLRFTLRHVPTSEESQVAPRKKTKTEETTPATPARKRATPAAKKKTADNGEQAPVTKTTRKRTTKTAEPAAAAPAAPARGGRNLVIVESPAKAKTIQKYLGGGYEVRASFGHIRDLPKKPPRGQIGIDIEAGWVPTYVNLDDATHQRVLSELNKLAAKS